MGVLRVLGVAFLLPAAAAFARPPDPALTFDWLGGMNDQHINAGGLHLRLGGVELSERARLSFYPEVQLQRWQIRDTLDDEDHAYLAGVMGFLRFSPGFCNRCFVDAGLGAFAIENRSALWFRPTGSNFTFSEQVGFGTYIDSKRRGELRIGWAHFSNAGVRKPNPGYDFIQLHARLRF